MGKCLTGAAGRDKIGDMETSMKPVHPIFERYTLDELSRLTGYGIIYLEAIRRGYEPARPRFKDMVRRILRVPEAELFIGQ